MVPSPVLPDRLTALVEAALWEIAEQTADAPEHTALDSTIDATRASLMAGMMPEEAQLLFRVADGSAQGVAASLPKALPVAVLDSSVRPDKRALICRMDQLDVRDEPRQTTLVVDSDGDEWEEWLTDGDATNLDPAKAIVAASERLAKERERVQNNSKINMRRRPPEETRAAAKAAAEAAADAVMSNLLSTPP